MIPLGVLASSYVAPAGGGGPLAVSYVTAVDNSTNLTTYTFTDVTIGAAATDRTVVIILHWRESSGAAISSVTIGGQAATVDHVNNYSSGYENTAIVRAAVPSGTTADVVVTFTALAVSATIGVFRVVGGSVSVHHVTGQSNPGLTTLDVNTDPGGVLIAGTTSSNSGVSMAGGVANNYALAPDGNRSAAGGCAVPTSSTTTVTQTSGVSCLAAVAYAPA